LWYFRSGQYQLGVELARKNVIIDINPLLHQRRFFVERRRLDGIYAGRGSGKSYTLVTIAALALLQGEKIIYLTPTTSLMRKDILKRVRDTLHSWGIKCKLNKSEYTIQVGKGIFFGASFENYDSALRGLDGVSTVLIDEIAKCKDLEDLFAVISPTMRNASFPPRTIYGSTPRKGSQCDKWIQKGRLGNPVMNVTIDDNTHVTEEERENMKSFLSGSLYEQEILGKIIDGDIDFAVFPHEIFGRQFVSPKGAPSLGIDCAGSGRDYNVFYVVDDTHIIDKVKVQKADTFQLASIARHLIQKYGVRQVCIDGTGGFGNGIYDLLKIDGTLDIHLINFGQSAEDSEHYANARAEMFFTLANGMREEFCVTEEEVTEQLKLISFELNGAGKSQIVSKDVLKKVLGCSPDSADALALAYYKRKNIRIMDVRKNSMYKPLRMHG